MANSIIPKEIEKAVLIGVAFQKDDTLKMEEYITELEFLTETAGAQVVNKFTQNLPQPNPKYYIGTGKMEEVSDFIHEEKVDMAIFDDELSPSQVRNLEKVFECKVLDRNGLILDIFAKRAQTSHARTQVELAQYEYLLPRLTGMWTHLQKQKGGIGTRGPGEREIETDRRIIRDKISLLKKRLKEIDKQKQTQRGNRGNMVRVALVGYTNVGKSTIMNLLSKANVFAEDKLFATLDTTVRKVVISNLPFLLTDTVGFIRKLPHSLVESFKSTLDEVSEADLIVHVVDISHPEFEDQMEVVHNTMAELNAGEKPTLHVFNKIDQYSFVEKEIDDLTPRTKENISLEELKNTWMNKTNENAVFISAKNKINIEEFKNKLYEVVKDIHMKRYPYNDFLY